VYAGDARDEMTLECVNGILSKVGAVVIGRYELILNIISLEIF